MKKDIDFPKLKVNETIGVITNFISEQLLDKNFKIVPLDFERYKKIIRTHNIKNIFVEIDIYETDHSWYQFDLKEIISELGSDDLNIIIVSTIDSLIPDQFRQYPQLRIDYSVDEITRQGNVLSVPLLIDEVCFNPADNTYETDIFYLKVGDKIEYEKEFHEFHSKFKPKIKNANPTIITREMIKRLIETVKHAKILYIIDFPNTNKTLYKFLILTSIAQNTMVFCENTDNDEDGYIIKVDSVQNAVDYIRGLIKNRLFWDKHVLSKNRRVFLENSFINKKSMSEFLNGNIEETKKIKNVSEVSVIVTTKRKENLETLFGDLNLQKHVNLQVILLTHGYTLSDSEKNHLRDKLRFELVILEESSGVSFGNCLNRCISFVDYEYVIKMDDDDFYFPNFIIDIYIGLKYSQAALVGKNAFFFYLEADNVVGKRRMELQFKDVREVKGNTLFSKTSTLREYMYSDLSRHVDSDLIIRLRDNGERIYSIHPYDMCVYRASDKSGHTFQVDDSRFLKDAEILYNGLPNKTVTTDE